MSLKASQLINTANVIAFRFIKINLALFRKSEKSQDESTN
jgi:hypothetical protein